MGLAMNTVQINEYCSWEMNKIIRFTLVCVHECGYVECVCVCMCIRVLVCVHTANGPCHNARARTTEMLHKQIHDYRQSRESHQIY